MDKLKEVRDLGQLKHIPVGNALRKMRDASTHSVVSGNIRNTEGLSDSMGAATPIGSLNKEQFLDAYNRLLREHDVFPPSKTGTAWSTRSS